MALSVLRISTVVLGVLLLDSSASLGGVGVWTTGGPLNGYINQIVVDPLVPGTIYAANGIFFKSVDGGIHWTAAMDGLTEPVGPIALDPFHLSTLLAANVNCNTSCSVVYRSTDAGASWVARSDGLPPGFVAQQLLFSKTEPGTAYALSVYSALYMTKDSGDQWIPMSLPDGVSPTFLAVSSDAAGTLFAANAAAQPFPVLLRSRDSGQTWVSIGSDLPPIVEIVVDPTRPSNVYAVANLGGLYLSEDGGDSWNQRGSGKVQAFAVDPSNSSTLYAGASDGVWKTLDKGRSWSLMSSGIPSCFGILVLAVSPASPTVIYAGSGFGLLRSIDGAENWLQVGRGFSRFRVSSLAAPSPDVLYSATDVIYRSLDGGMNWQASCEATALLAAGPGDPKTVFGTLGGCMGFNGGCVCAGRITRSRDGGISWADVLNIDEVTAIEVDPRTPERVYSGVVSEDRSCARGSGLIVSADQGDTWTSLWPVSLNAPITQVRVDQSAPDTIFLATSWAYSGSVPSDVGIWKSSDGGVNWAKLTNLNVTALELDPGGAGTLYAGTDRGAFRTLDGGKTWSLTGFTDSVTALAVSPDGSGSVFVGTPESGVFRSGDQGKTWKPMNEGLSDLSMTALAIDPTGKLLHAATNSGGVFDIAITAERLVVQPLPRTVRAIEISPR